MCPLLTTKSVYADFLLHKFKRLVEVVTMSELDMLMIKPFPIRRYGADGQTCLTRRFADIDETWT